MLFFVIVGVLILIAFLFVLPPLWRKQTVQEIYDIDQRNILIAQHRLQELKDNKLKGDLTEEQYNEQLADLEQALSDDLDIKSQVTPLYNQGRWVVFVVVLTIPLLASWLYADLGNYPAVSHSAEMAADPDKLKFAEINKMVTRLAEKMQNNPDDAQGWLMLGRSYTAMEEFPKAVEALANAYRLLGDKPEVMLLYADALAYVNDKNLTGKPAELVFKALALEPDNMNALWLGGMAKAQQGDTVEAAKLWKKLESLLPAGSDSQKEVQDLLSKLASESPEAMAIDQSQTTQTAKVPDSANSTATIKVEVSLTPGLQNKYQAKDTVFIYAQAVSGPKMPLAIVRKQVSDLPLTVSLDDTLAMMPTMRLSNFSQVRLLARLSKSGNAITQPDDLIGVIEQVELNDKNPHKIVIGEQKK